MLFGDVANVHFLAVRVGDEPAENLFDDVDAERGVEHAPVRHLRVRALGAVDALVNGYVVVGLAAVALRRRLRVNPGFRHDQSSNVVCITLYHSNLSSASQIAFRWASVTS